MPSRALPLLSLLAAACGPGLQPGATPTPEAPPGAPVTAAPTAAVAFAYGDGSAAALVESRATIDVADDSSAARDTVVTTARVRWQIGGADGSGAAPVPGAAPVGGVPGGAAGDARRLTVVVDSFTVRAGGHVPAGAMPLPVRVDGVARGGRVELDAPVGPPPPPTLPVPPPPLTLRRRAAEAARAASGDTVHDGCTEPAAAVLGSVRELFPALPTRLAPGARWTDTVTTTACPGGVRLVTTAVHRYVVAGATEVGGRPAARLERASELLVRGEGEQAREHVTADGRGTGRATLLVDLAAGRLAELVGESTLELSFTGAGRTQRVVQRATVRVQPLP